MVPTELEICVSSMQLLALSVQHRTILSLKQGIVYLKVTELETHIHIHTLYSYLPKGQDLLRGVVAPCYQHYYQEIVVVLTTRCHNSTQHSLSP